MKCPRENITLFLNSLQNVPFYLVQIVFLRHHESDFMKRFGFVGVLFSTLLLCKSVSVHSVPLLTSDKPVVYDIKKRASVAEGNAEFLNEGLRVQADKIYYFAENAKALAEGHVRITNGDYRFLAPSGAYCHTEQTVEAASFHMATGGHGYRGEALRGQTKERLVADHVRLDYRGVHDRDLLGFHILARQGVLRPKKDVVLKDAVVKIGPVPVLVSPIYRHNFEEAWVRWKSEWTLLQKKPSEKYGHYMRNDIRFHMGWPVKPGVMIDYYRKQGVLAGFMADYEDRSTPLGKGHIEGARIHDENLDLANRAIDKKGHDLKNSRFWFEWQHVGHVGTSNDLAVHTQWMRDPYVIKDFRPANNDGTRQHPDNFVEVSHRGDASVTSLLVRYKLNRFQRIQERLPEIRYEHALEPIADTPFYQQYGLGVSHLRERPLDEKDTEIFDETYEADKERILKRTDAFYGVTMPIDCSSLCTVTPLAGGRVAHYFGLNRGNRNQYTRFLGQVGFDVRLRSYGDYSYTNEWWNIHDFRHLMKPFLQYRYMPDGHSGNAFIPAVDREAVDTNEQSPSLRELDLLHRRDIDDCHGMHVVRLGFENSLYTNFENGGSTQWMYLNAYQDFNLKCVAGNRSLAHKVSDTHVDFGWNPAPFFGFNEKLCYSFAEKQLLSMDTSVSFKEGELWTASITHTYQPGNPRSKTKARKTSNQLSWNMTYHINSTNAFSVGQKFDLHKTDFISQTYTWHTLLAKTWNLDVVFKWSKRGQWEIKFLYRFAAW